MKILKIFGVVVAVHAAVFMFVFAIPGCRTTARQTPTPPAPETNAPAPTVSYPGAAPAGANATPSSQTGDVSAPASDTVPAVSFNSPRYNPTRPGTPAAALLESSEVGGVTPASTYKVASNDSLWKIAKKFGIGVEDLAKANNLRPNSPLKVGQKLIVPGKKAGNGPAGTRTYTVRAGDSLGTIARKNGTTMSDIRSLNPGIKGDTVRPGQELVLPASGKSAAAAASAPVAPAAPSMNGPAPAGSVEHIVKSGESLAQIAKKYGVPQKEIAKENNLADPKNLRAGQKLIIPGMKTPSASPAIPAVTVAPSEPAPVAPVVTAPSNDAPVAPATSPEVNPVTAPASDTPPPPVVKVDESAPVTPAQ
jgi:LysM repeat protein